MGSPMAAADRTVPFLVYKQHWLFGYCAAHLFNMFGILLPTQTTLLTG